MNSTGSDKEPSPRWIKPELRLDNMILVLGMLGAIAAGIWQGGRIQQTMQDGINQEAETRKAQNAAMEQQLAAQASTTKQQMSDIQDTLNQVRQDVRELRSYMMVPHELGGPRR